MIKPTERRKKDKGPMWRSRWKRLFSKKNRFGEESTVREDIAILTEAETKTKKGVPITRHEVRWGHGEQVMEYRGPQFVEIQRDTPFSQRMAEELPNTSR